MPSTHPRTGTALVGATVLVAATFLNGTFLSATAAHAEPLTCQGQAVTVAGNTGTDGDDVMVVSTDGGAVTATSGAGDDLVCIRVTTGQEPFLLTLDAGPGDDRVVNESSNGSTRVTAVLGTGSDTYAGNDLSETVVAGAAAFGLLGDTTDTETDAIETRGGDDHVTSGSTAPGATNRDSISTGDGDDGLRWAGEQVGAAVDLGAGTNGVALYPGWVGTSVAVDVAAHVATVDGRAAMRWSGQVGRWELALDSLRTGFTGTDADESLVVRSGVGSAPGQALPSPDPAAVRRIDMRGGDDRVEMSDVVGGEIVGGAGHDRLSVGYCPEAVVRLGETYSCLRAYNPRIDYTGTIDAWEDVAVTGAQVKVVGTDGRDRIDVDGFHVRIDGRSGRDTLTASAHRSGEPSGTPVVIRGGRGADTITGSFTPDRLLGGRGADRIDGSGGADTVLGGPGNDVLVGGRRADRLWGGPGRDRADGQAGHDRCAAEVRRSCDRP